MPQQADGWQEPEFSIYRISPAEPADLSWLGGPNPGFSNPALQPGRAPWIETVAASAAPAGLPKPPQITPVFTEGLHSHAFLPATRSAAFSEPFNAQNTIASLIHDTRNMITTIDLYCDLLEVPGVLAAPFRHYAGELRLVAGGSRRLLEKLATIELLRAAEPSPSADPMAYARDDQAASATATSRQRRSEPFLADPYFFDTPPTEQLPKTKPWASGISLVNKPATPFVSDTDFVSDLVDLQSVEAAVGSAFHLPPENLSRSTRGHQFDLGAPIESLADELMANQRLLSALSGPAITVGLSIEGGNRAVAIAADNLTRVLVNLVRNATEAMPCGGHIQIALQEISGRLSLSFTDSGVGIPEAALEAIFTPGYTSRVDLQSDTVNVTYENAWPAQHRGLGLPIVRSIVRAAGGIVWASNRSSAQPSHPLFETSGRASTATHEQPSGAVLTIEFPIDDQAEIEA